MNPNYPAFLPIVHHDISTDIGLPFQTFCYSYYRGMQIFIMIGSVLDCIASIIITATTQMPLAYFGFKVMYLFLVPIYFFFLVYFPIYKALKNNFSIDWTIFFFGQGAYIIFSILSMVGSVNYIMPLFPGGDSGFYMVSYYFASRQPAAGYSALAIRLFHLVGLFFWIFVYIRAYQICKYERGQPTSSATSPKKSSKNQKEVSMVVVVDKGKVGKMMTVNHAFEGSQNGDLALKVGDTVSITKIGKIVV